MDKKRRLSTMEEPKKGSKIEGIEEIREKEVEKTDLKVRDDVDVIGEFAGIIKESYITSLQLFFSLWEENLKIMKEQAEVWARMHEESTKPMREPFGRFQTDAGNFWGGNSMFINTHVEKMITFQKEYSHAVINTSDKFMKETLGLMKNSINKIFWSFNEYAWFD
jgi:hypothetical protein